MIFFLEPERAGHAATARIENLEIQPDFFEQSDFVGTAHDRAMMAMDMNQGFTVQLLWFVVRGAFLQKLTEKECLVSEPGGALVGGK